MQRCYVRRARRADQRRLRRHRQHVGHGRRASARSKARPAVGLSRTCAEPSLGTLTILPSGADDAEVGIKVVMGVKRAADTCSAPDYVGCVVARRAVRFVPGRETRVVVEMDLACLDVPCGALESCKKGQCVPVTCAGDAECGPDGGGPDGALVDGAVPDGAVVVPDATVADGAVPDAGPDASTDASLDGPSCAGSCVVGERRCTADLEGRARLRDHGRAVPRARADGQRQRHVRRRTRRATVRSSPRRARATRPRAARARDVCVERGIRRSLRDGHRGVPLRRLDERVRRSEDVPGDAVRMREPRRLPPELRLLACARRVRHRHGGAVRHERVPRLRLHATRDAVGGRRSVGGRQRRAQPGQLTASRPSTPIRRRAPRRARST